MAPTSLQKHVCMQLSIDRLANKSSSSTLTESQNGRGWQGPLGATWSNPLLKHGHSEQIAQVAFEDLQEWRLHNLSGQPVPVLHHMHSREVPPGIQREPPVFQFVPTVSCPGIGQHCKESVSVLFAPFLQVFLDISEIPPEFSLLQVEQSQPSQPLLRSASSPLSSWWSFVRLFPDFSQNHRIVEVGKERSLGPTPLPKQVP